MVLNGKTEIGIVVAFISGLGRILDPWRELIAFVRSTSTAKVQFDLIESTLGRKAVKSPFTLPPKRPPRGPAVRGLSPQAREDRGSRVTRSAVPGREEDGGLTRSGAGTKLRPAATAAAEMLDAGRC